jgi:DNA-binding response OmpR family regulator
VRVLIVEDEPKMAALLQRGLTEAGFAADAVHDGEEALWRAGPWRTTPSSSTSCSRAWTG